MDAFWDRSEVDSWNEKHSPRKQLFVPTAPKSPEKKMAIATADVEDAKRRRTEKKAFEARKRDLAVAFLKELDDTITGGELARLAEPTGGVSIVWNNKLNTTAGRANWRREKIRRIAAATAARTAGDDEAKGSPEQTVTVRHHAEIELAEKVIDSDERLLNVVAHEFCHLANFMVSGVSNNPHGREFKVWATKVSRRFGDRGVEVTTKHSYDIAFRYAWECEGCATVYGRHSRSIDPARQACGKCRGVLRQTRPAPRGGAAGPNKGTKKDVGEGTGAKEPTEYQVFVKDAMRRLRVEMPGSPAKDLMKRAAEEWNRSGRKSGSKRQAKTEDDQTSPAESPGLSEVAKAVEVFVIDDD